MGFPVLSVAHVYHWRVQPPFMSSLGQCYRTGSSACAFFAECLLLKGIKNHELNASCTVEGRHMVCPWRVSDRADWSFTGKSPLKWCVIEPDVFHLENTGFQWPFAKSFIYQGNIFFCGLKSCLTVFTHLLSSQNFGLDSSVICEVLHVCNFILTFH